MIIFSLFLSTSLIHFGIEMARFSNYVVSIVIHTFFRASFMSFTLKGHDCTNLFFMTCQAFSMGFKSGALPGQSSTSIPWPARNFFTTFDLHEKNHTCECPKMSGDAPSKPRIILPLHCFAFRDEKQSTSATHTTE